jgi:hypothetical protein
MKISFIIVALSAVSASAQVRFAPAQSAAAMPAYNVQRLTSVSNVPALTAPVAPDLVRLMITSTDAKDPFIHVEAEKALSAALTASSAKARMLESGGGAVFKERLFVETDRAGAQSVAERLKAIGLQSVEIGELLSRMNAGAGTLATEEELQEASALFDKGDALQRAEAFGRLASAADSIKESGLTDSLETRLKAANDLYSGIVPILDAFNTIRDDRRQALLKKQSLTLLKNLEKKKAAIGGTDYVAREYAVEKELAQPEFNDQLKPFQALASRAATAIIALDSPFAASLVNALLPQAQHAAALTLAASPEMLSHFIQGWIGYLDASVAETASLADTTERYGYGSNTGIGQNHVVGRRESVVYSRMDSKQPFQSEREDHNASQLLGMSAAAAEAWTGRFVALLSHADAAVADIEAAEHRRRMLAESNNFDEMAKKFAKNSEDADRIAELKRQHMADAEKKYQEYQRIDGLMFIDRAVQTLGYYGPYERLTPGFDENLYVANAAGVLRAALEGVTGVATLKIIVDSALGLVESVRKYAAATLAPESRQAIDGLEQLARETAKRLNLELAAGQN